jgi:hypothetical protein
MKEDPIVTGAVIALLVLMFTALIFIPLWHDWIALYHVIMDRTFRWWRRKRELKAYMFIENMPPPTKHWWKVAKKNYVDRKRTERIDPNAPYKDGWMILPQRDTVTRPYTCEEVVSQAAPFETLRGRNIVFDL